MEEKKAGKTVEKTVLGIGQNIEGLLCYILGFVSGIFFLLVEKENKFVRFHAMQSVAVSVALFVISTVAAMVPIIGWIVLLLLGPCAIVLWIVMMWKAYSGELFKLPIVGDIAEKQTK